VVIDALLLVHMGCWVNVGSWRSTDLTKSCARVALGCSLPLLKNGDLQIFSANARALVYPRPMKTESVTLMEFYSGQPDILNAK